FLRSAGDRVWLVIIASDGVVGCGILALSDNALCGKLAEGCAALILFDVIAVASSRHKASQADTKCNSPARILPCWRHLNCSRIGMRQCEDWYDWSYFME
ncbi:hypothetical protein, partial [Leisingera sp. F5]|uniref:hypothetical protein n=1 Tax=Leisingera sp. F5 TaxID=1813816 RepID=UPI0025BA50F0